MRGRDEHRGSGAHGRWPAVAARAASLARSAVRSWIASSPGTHIWLLVIGITSLVIAAASQDLEMFLLHRNSSNIHQLTKHPLRALLISGFWIENPSSFLLYAALFELLHANVERWTGTARWLFTVGFAHIAATLVSQEVVLLSIEDHSLPRSMKRVVDIGVSYGLAAAAGILTYRMPRPWRWVYLAGLVLFFAVPLATGGTFTDVGHAVAAAIGLGCRQFTQGRPPWDFGCVPGVLRRAVGAVRQGIPGLDGRSGRSGQDDRSGLSRTDAPGP
ncbi:rhomboid-like protein [Streptomyces sp. NRRL B-1677]|uniref:rhomboid-like protein n=1 Tax=Streptomyces sp. NRRL B-1677 TaxID=2682966 RepID=UPI003A7F26DA